MQRTLTNQRNSGDCGIAALTTFTGLRFEDVYVAAVAVDKRIPAKGANVKELIAVAKRLGRILQRVHWRKVDLESDDGILGINWNDPKKHGGAKGHWVVLTRGLIIDGTDVKDAEEYLLVENGRVGTLLAER